MSLLSYILYLSNMKLSLTILSALVLSANASYNQVSEGVVRIELTKEFIPKQEQIELDDTSDGLITIEDSTYT